MCLGGALLREVAKLVKFESDTIGDLGEKALGRSAAERSHDSRCSYVHPRSSGKPWCGESSVQIPGADSAAGTQSHSGSDPLRSLVEQASSMARLFPTKRTKNANELQSAVVQWELTLVEHEAKFTEVVPDKREHSSDESFAPQGHA